MPKYKGAIIFYPFFTLCIRKKILVPPFAYGKKFWSPPLASPKNSGPPNKVKEHPPHTNNGGGSDYTKEWMCCGSRKNLIIYAYIIYAYLLHVENGTTLQSGTKMVPFLEVELKWLLLGEWSHNVVLKRYLKGGHPVDLKMAPLWSHFGSIFFLSMQRAIGLFCGYCTADRSNLKADRPHLRDYPHTPTGFWLFAALNKAQPLNGSAVRAFTDIQTDATKYIISLLLGFIQRLFYTMHGHMSIVTTNGVYM